LRQLDRIVQKVCATLEQAQALVQSVKLEDRLINELSAHALCVFSIDSAAMPDMAAIAARLQMTALHLMQGLFHRHAGLREVIVEDIFGVLIKLPNNKKSLRCYRLYQNPAQIQMVSALIMLLVQGCTDSASTPLSHTAGPIATSFVSLFLQRCSRKDTGSEFRTLLSNLVDDLLTVISCPEWPAAEMLLATLASHLASCLGEKGGKDGGQKEKDGTYCAYALDVLGRVCMHLRCHLRKCRENPLALSRQATTVNAEGRPDMAGENDTCVCGKGFEEMFMLDCDQCHRWFHGVCVGQDENDPPEKWMCDDCTIQECVAAQKVRLYQTLQLPEGVLPPAPHKYTPAGCECPGCSELRAAAAREAWCAPA